MDGRQKSTLRHYQVKLAEELIMDEDFYAALRQRKLFTDHMIGLIKAEPTEKDRIYKMIKILPKRGPEAFGKFIGILQENFSWLADMLEDGYADICQQKDATDGPADDAVTESPRVISHTQHNRRSSFEPPARPNRRAYHQQHSLPAMSAASDAGTPRHAPVLFFPKDFALDFADAGVTHDMQNSRVYKDACVSPILTIESPRKMSANPKAYSQRYERRDTSQKMELIIADADGETDNTDDEDAADGCPSMPIKQPINDGSLNHTSGNDKPDITQQGECGKKLPDTKLELGDTAQKRDTYQDDGASTPECQCRYKNRTSPETKAEERKLMADICSKLNKFIEENKVYDSHGFKHPVRPRHIMENGTEASLELIDDLVDELTEMLFNERNKLLDKCYYLVNTKDRKLALNVCIENLNEENRDLTKRLKEEEKKSNEMADDMYKHSQEMKKLDKIRARERHLEAQNQVLKEKCIEFERLREESQQNTSALQKEVLRLQYIEQENEYTKSQREEKKTVKKPNQVGRKLSLASVNRKPGLYPSSESRVSLQRSYSTRVAPTTSRGHLSTFRQKRP